MLRSLGITPVHELRGVGENLRDHYSPRLKFAIAARNMTFNDNARGWRLAREAMIYALFGTGFLASTAVPIRMYFRTREGLETPDATISILPFLYEMVGRQRRVAKRQGITMNANVLRSESTGSIHIKSADPGEPPAIRFNFLSTEHDRAGILAVIRKGRELMATSPLKEITGEEIAPGAKLQSDAELLDWVRNNAETTYHPVGTCKMGSDPLAVVDRELRVHGIEGSARCRCVDHADADQRQHQCARDHDRREVRRDGAGFGCGPQGCCVANQDWERPWECNGWISRRWFRPARACAGSGTQPVARAVIEDIIDVAKRAPSSMNTQPWHIHVLTGEPLDELRRRNMEEMVEAPR